MLEAEQLLGRVMGPVDRVEDVHLLRHLLGHGVTSKRVNVGVDLGTECGQEVIAVHHLGAASLGLSLQRPGLGEGDCSQGQVAEYYHRDTSGALPAPILAPVSPPWARVSLLSPASGLQLSLVTSTTGLCHQVLGGED